MKHMVPSKGMAEGSLQNGSLWGYGQGEGKPVKGSRASVGEAVTTIGLKGKGEEVVIGTN